MEHKEIRGLISAVVTPFKADGSIDYKRFAHHVEHVALTKMDAVYESQLQRAPSGDTLAAGSVGL